MLSIAALMATVTYCPTACGVCCTESGRISANVTGAVASSTGDDDPLCKTLCKGSNFRDCVKLCGYLDRIMTSVFSPGTATLPQAG